jgi:hypothetical protein
MDAEAPSIVDVAGEAEATGSQTDLEGDHWMIAEIAILAAGLRKAAGQGSEMIANVATATQMLIFEEIHAMTANAVKRI